MFNYYFRLGYTEYCVAPQGRESEGLGPGGWLEWRWLAAIYEIIAELYIQTDRHYVTLLLE